MSKDEEEFLKKIYLWCIDRGGITDAEARRLIQGAVDQRLDPLPGLAGTVSVVPLDKR